MAGVNLSEENARILASGSELVGSVIRSCQEEPFLFPSALQSRLLQIVSNFVSCWMLMFSVVCVSCGEDDWRYSQTNDIYSQLKFLEQLERLEKQRREEEEREALLRIARVTSRHNKRGKKHQESMQQLELAQMEHRDANLAALAAPGSRKRKPLEAPGSGANQVPAHVHTVASLLGSCGQFATRAPIRVTLRDLTFCMEQDPTFRHTLMLYREFLG
uniref:Transcription initiation factor TFIID component TAF4 C-terminal domain-containing protein n=1 Tax=Sinocyclocheilus rhinocerous TaxID=307959 RepID=A0A673MGW4_9TELE